METKHAGGEHVAFLLLCRREHSAEREMIQPVETTRQLMARHSFGPS